MVRARGLYGCGVGGFGLYLGVDLLVESAAELEFFSSELRIGVACGFLFCAVFFVRGFLA